MIVTHSKISVRNSELLLGELSAAGEKASPVIIL
jgi:hypothetical protein